MAGISRLRGCDRGGPGANNSERDTRDGCDRHIAAGVTERSAAIETWRYDRGLHIASVFWRQRERANYRCRRSAAVCQGTSDVDRVIAGIAVALDSHKVVASCGLGVAGGRAMRDVAAGGGVQKPVKIAVVRVHEADANGAQPGNHQLVLIVVAAATDCAADTDTGTDVSVGG